MRGRLFPMLILTCAVTAIAGAVEEGERRIRDCSGDAAITPNPCARGATVAACGPCTVGSGDTLFLTITGTQASGLAPSACVAAPVNLGVCSGFDINCTRTFECTFGPPMDGYVCSPLGGGCVSAPNTFGGCRGLSSSSPPPTGPWEKVPHRFCNLDQSGTELPAVESAARMWGDGTT